MAEITKPDLSLIWASSGDVLKPSDSKIQSGWAVEIPPRQWFNWLDNRQDQAIAHINQHGIPVWDDTTEYIAGKSYVQSPASGEIFRAVQTNIGRNPDTDANDTYWESFSGSGGEVPVDNTQAPPSLVAAFARSSAPLGWLKCNGAAVSRTTYASLFAAIGTTFGAGDGTTTFNLPDLRGEFIRGWNDDASVDSARVFGSKQSDSFRSHNHIINISSAGSHTHNTVFARDLATYTSTSNNAVYGDEVRDGTDTVATNSAGNHTHNATASLAGGNETRPRNVALLYCIKY